MPQIQVIFYQDTNGTVPVLIWLDDLFPKIRAKCIVKIERLRDPNKTRWAIAVIAGVPPVRSHSRERGNPVLLGPFRELGHELRRPEADYLRDDIYELRIAYRSVQYRLLYFFYRRNTAVISHGIVKGQRVPPAEIDLAVQRKRAFEQNPGQHTY